MPREHASAGDWFFDEEFDQLIFVEHAALAAPTVASSSCPHHWSRSAGRTG
jgi:hypothetical protein